MKEKIVYNNMQVTMTPVEPWKTIFSSMEYGQIEFKTNKFQQKDSWTKIVNLNPFILKLQKCLK